MRKTIVILALAAIPIAGVTTACNSAWWQQFISDPVAQVQTFDQAAQVVLNDAQLAWATVVPFLPAAQAAAITTQFNNALQAVNHAIQVLNDAVTAAVAAQQPSPDFSTLMAAVTNAIGQVLAIVAEYTSMPAVVDAAPAAATGKAPYTPALADAYSILGNLQRQYVKTPAAAH